MGSSPAGRATQPRFELGPRAEQTVAPYARDEETAESMRDRYHRFVPELHTAVGSVEPRSARLSGAEVERRVEAAPDTFLPSVLGPTGPGSPDHG
ncbi:hypothetical protein [Nocardiopsis lucentensis]|uniref:hypothetical protein n=1 Tax=Nocardiopsis lucentensis TaxID=53441 RepID=UPI0012696048|nr:hypothetical protein [Nocardiopsis lucentensis]